MPKNWTDRFNVEIKTEGNDALHSLGLIIKQLEDLTHFLRESYHEQDKIPQRGSGGDETAECVFYFIKHHIEID